MPAALGLLSLASLERRCRRRPSPYREKPLALPWSALSISGIARPLKARQRRGGETGGKVIGVDGGRDNQVHANNHDILLSRKVDAVISILGDSAVEPKFKALRDAGIPVFTVDHVSQYSVNNTTSDNLHLRLNHRPLHGG
ncbi:hypothetical protein LNQ52_00200 [Klebsiella pneumoniae subsp. pneumoniae]|nr:hypothetical protein [Klebsiella pneumoniae subsp. pneumoniae]